jgi:hypothetical protein
MARTKRSKDLTSDWFQSKYGNNFKRSPKSDWQRLEADKVEKELPVRNRDKTKKLVSSYDDVYISALREIKYLFSSEVNK